MTETYFLLFIYLPKKYLQHMLLLSEQKSTTSPDAKTQKEKRRGVKKELSGARKSLEVKRSRQKFQTSCVHKVTQLF